MKTKKHNYYYVETNYGYMCSFDQDFEDVWFVDSLDSDEPIEGPECNIVRMLIADSYTPTLMIIT